MKSLPKIECNGCRLCCIGDTIFLTEHDDINQYKTVFLNGAIALAKGSDGNCVYLSESGCSIYDNQPHMCRKFDCRDYYLSNETNYDKLRDPLKRHVILEGRRRVNKLRADDII